MYNKILEKHGLQYLTIKQREAMLAIMQYAKEHGGLFPSLRDAQAILQLSSISEADRYYKLLIAKGYFSPITDEEGRRLARGCKVSDNFTAALQEVQAFTGAADVG